MVDKGIPIRLVVYGAAFVYLVVDLALIGGPLRKALFRKNPNSPEVIAAAKEEGVVARVYYQPILLTQVDRRVEEELWKSGRSLDGLAREDRRLLRLKALNDLIDLHLLRLKARYNHRQYPVSEADIDAEVERFVKRFPNEKELQKALEGRGWSEKELRYRLAARLQQERYLEGMIEIEVSEEEARIWFEDNRESLAQPERMRVRHIFVATLNRDGEEAKKVLEGAKAKIEGREETFADLARVLSEDERSKERGGDLGWIHRGRIDPELVSQVEGLAERTLSLISTGIGWHLVEVLERKPRTLRSFEEARADVMAALEAVKRDRGLKAYRKQLRKQEEHKVQIFHDVLERGLE